MYKRQELINTFTETYVSGAQHPTTLTSLGDSDFPETVVPGSLAYSAAVSGQVLGQIQTGVIMPGTPQFAQAVQAFAPFQQEGWLYQSLSPITAARPDVFEEIDDSQVSGTFKLSYQLDEDKLVYASYGKGYKSGGLNTDRIGEDFDPVFDAETSNAFELGFKADFPDQALRLNVAAHFTQIDDFQANSFVNNGFVLQNAGDYETKGVEIEAMWLPTETTTISMAFAHTKAIYKELSLIHI